MEIINIAQKFSLFNEHWSPRIVGEFEDSALLKVFGQQGLGVFAAPMAIRSEAIPVKIAPTTK